MQPGNKLIIESLDENWRDKDSIMLHACFQILKDCVDEEKLLNCHIDWDSDKKHREAKKELQDLYDWWLQYKQAEMESDIPNWEQHNLENEMLHRLINVRWALWT